MGRVIVAGVAGQSNNEGRGNTREAEDTDVPGVRQFVSYVGDPNYRTAISDITPLLSQNPFAGAGGYGSDRVGPGEYIPREHLDNDPSIVEIYIVPMAVGGSTIVSGTPTWNSSPTPGAGGTYFEFMINQMNLAVAQAQADHPSDTIEVQLYWCQGEFDASNGTTKAQMITALTDLINRFRARVSLATNAPVIIGSMIPRSWTIGSANYSAGHAGINEAHVAVSLQMTNVYYVKGPGTNTTGSNDFVHYSPVSFVREQGRRDASILYRTVGPNLTSPATSGSALGNKLAIALSSDEIWGHATYHIVGGADAALFEISDPYISPKLRWAGDGTGPTAAGDYSVDIAARDGAGLFGATQTHTTSVSGEVSPTAMFASSELGYVYDNQLIDIANMSQNIDGTVACAVDSPVGWQKDQSPNANHRAATANDATRPILRQHATTGKYYLEFTGSQKLYSLQPFIQTTDARFTTFAGIFAAAPAATAITNCAASSSSAIPFVNAIQVTSAGAVAVNLRNDASSGGSVQATVTGMFNGVDLRVLTTAYNGSGSTIRIRDATRRPSDGLSGYASPYGNSVTQTTMAQNFTVNRTTFGCRGDNAPDSFFPHNEYCNVGINRFVSDLEVKATEEWVNNRSRTSLLPGQLPPTTSLNVPHFSTESPDIGDPGFASGSSNTDLTIVPFNTGSPVIDAPVFVEKQAFTIAAISIGSPAIGTPAVGQKHSLAIGAFATASPAIATPSLGTAGTVALTVPSIDIVSLGNIGPTLAQKHALSISSINIGSPSIGSPTLGLTRNFTIAAFSTASPDLGVVSAAEIILGGKLLRENVLSAEDENRYELADIEMRVLS